MSKKVKRIEHFILPEQTNNLYKEEAISSIALTKDVADKINEIVDSLNEIAKMDYEKFQEQDGKIRKGIIYMKDNLLNTLHDLTKLFVDGGLFDEYIQKYIGDLEASVNAIINGATKDDEVKEARFGADGVIYETLGTAIREQIRKLENLIKYIKGYDTSIYNIPLTFEYSGSDTYGSFYSLPFMIPENGCSVRMTEFIEETINGVKAKFLVKVELGKIAGGSFIVDAEKTAKYSPGVYSNRIFFIPYIEGTAIKISASFIGGGNALITNSNYKECEKYLDYVKVYTGEISKNNSVMGLTPVTPRKSETEEKYSLEWGLNGLTWKYQALSSPLPLKYVKSVSVNPNMWIGAKIYKFNPAKRENEFVKTLHYNDTHPCFGSECVIDFTEYNDNYFAILIVGKVPLNSDYQSAKFGTSAGTNNATLLGLDLSEIEAGINVEWIGDNVLAHGIEGVSLPVQKNIELLKNLHHKAVTGRYNRDTSQTFYQIYNQDNFAGVFYGGGYQTGTFFYNISPVSYFTALLNPNSNAYGDCDTTLSGNPYGIVCSNFTALLHGWKCPVSTFDFRYNYLPGFDIEKFDLNKDLASVKLLDVLTQGEGETGHSVMLTDILNVDNNITALKVLESTTPATREGVFFLHNGLDYIKSNPEDWYFRAYDFIARAKPEHDDTIFDKANWEVPYTEPQVVMASRGYGSLYLANKNRIILSVDPKVTTLYLDKVTPPFMSKDQYDRNEYGYNECVSKWSVEETTTISDLTPLILEQKNGYNLVDITDHIHPSNYNKVLESAGDPLHSWNIRNNVDNSNELIHYINTAESVYFGYEGGIAGGLSEEFKAKIPGAKDWYGVYDFTYKDWIKYINVVYTCQDGTHAGKTASMCFDYDTWLLTDGEAVFPGTIETDIGTWKWDGSGNHLNIIYKTPYDTNTFVKDYEWDIGN